MKLPEKQLEKYIALDSIKHQPSKERSRKPSSEEGEKIANATTIDWGDGAKYQNLVPAMISCKQTKGQNVLQHGLSVWDYFQHILTGQFDGWRVPSWLELYREPILRNIHPVHSIRTYLVFHDCGKPQCSEVDENGAVHFPNHSQVSKQIFLEACCRDRDGFSCDVTEEERTIANLIGWDMIVHTATAKEIASYCENIWTKTDAFTLLLAALAEVHSNASMFGGVESDSFKAKWKKVERRGKQICKLYFGKPE